MNSSGNVVFLHAGEIDFAKLIADAKTEFELFGVCDRICSVFALPYFNIMRLPGETDHLGGLILPSPEKERKSSRGSLPVNRGFGAFSGGN